MDAYQDTCFELANSKDVENLYYLLNVSYRDEIGWTNEANLIHGERITREQLENLLKRDDFELWVMKINNDLQGCIGLTIARDFIEIGTYAIKARLQGLGYGTLLLKHIENYISEKWNSHYIKMLVINCRYELIDFYQRRDYIVSGETAGFPIDGNVGTPIVPLHLIVLEKHHHI